MPGHALASGIAGILLSLFSPLANTAFTAPAYNALDCGIWINQSSVSAGSAAQLTWWSTNAAQATLSESGAAPYAVAVSGSKTVVPQGSSTYTLSVRDGAGNTKACAVSLSVSTNASLPVCTLSATPGTHVAGQPVRLIWYTQYATGANLSGFGAIPASQLPSGYADMYPAQSTVYTMTVANGAGSRTCSALVTLAAQSPQPAPYATGYVPTPQPIVYSPTYYPSSYPTYAPTYTASYPTSGTAGYTYPSNGTYSTAYFDTVDNYLDQVDANTGGGISVYNPNSSYYYSDFNDPSAYYVAPSQSNGLGDYTLTNTFNSFGDIGTPYDNAYYGVPYAQAPGTSIDWNDNSAYYTNSEPQAPASSPFDYYGTYDNSTYSQPSEQQWYDWGDNSSGWNGGTDPNSSGVYYGGTDTNNYSWDGWI